MNMSLFWYNKRGPLISLTLNFIEETDLHMLIKLNDLKPIRKYS